MPSTEYICKDCGADFKRLVFLGEEDTKSVCPKCMSTDIEKLDSTEELFQGISNHSSLAGDRN
jgi:putative FmdB family regulatory protein